VSATRSLDATVEALCGDLGRVPADLLEVGEYLVV
jgi:hypothetical protein